MGYAALCILFLVGTSAAAGRSLGRPRAAVGSRAGDAFDLFVLVRNYSPTLCSWEICSRNALQVRRRASGCYRLPTSAPPANFD
jgi:hypothetical protein